MKHAFCIMAHNEFYLLKELIQQLDDSDFDIYLHIDKKSNFKYIDSIKNWRKNGPVYLIPQKKVYWGDYSLIQCELDLFQGASKKKYDYYHLLSGVDFPLKTNLEIKEFFLNNKNKEFIHFSSEQFNEDSSFKYNYYHIFQRFLGRGYSKLTLLNKGFLKIQQLFICRSNKTSLKICGGSNWCSVTHRLVTYLLKNRFWIKRQFSYTCACDEFYKQTLVKQKFDSDIFRPTSSFNGESNLRYIDWRRGNPYTFKEEDLNELLSSDCLFARKFTCENENGKRLIKAIKDALKSK